MLNTYFELEKLKPEEVGFLVQLAENAERYLDMCQFIRQLVTAKLADTADGNEVLNSDQRNLFSVAYKNVVGSKRQALRQLHERIGEEKESEKSNLKEADKEIYINTIREELFMWCKEILVFLTKLVEKSKTRMDKLEKEASEKEAYTFAVESTVFYKKMIGDYYRYLAEEFKDEKSLKTACEEAYKGALEIANEKLQATNATRLGLALNFSVAYYEIMKKPKEACDLAKTAFDAAIEKLDSLNDTSYKDSTLIMQLLRDNLTLWTSDEGDS